MKKLVLGLLVVVAVLGLGVATWSAWAVEGRHRALVDTLAQHPDVRLLDARYTRGWLRSSAEASLELRGAAGELYAARLREAGVPDIRSRVGLRVRQRIVHGPLALWRWLREGAVDAPVVARVRTRVELDNETESELAPVFGRLPPLRIDTALRASGRAEGRVAIAPGRFEWRHLPPDTPEAELAEETAERAADAARSGETEEPLRVDWRGLTGTVAARDAFAGTSPLTARLAIHGLRLVRGERARRLRDLRLDLELRALASGATELDWSARLASFELVRLDAPGGGDAGGPPARPVGAEVAEAESGGGERAGAGARPGSERGRALFVLEGGGASGRLVLGRPTTGTVEAELASLRTQGASLGPLRLELDLRAAPPIAGPLVEATLRKVELDTPAGAVRGDGRVRLTSPAGEAWASASLEERLEGEVVLEASARVADWLRVRSPALRRVLDAHAAPEAGGERVRAHLRLEEGALAEPTTTTARRDEAPGA